MKFSIAILGLCFALVAARSAKLQRRDDGHHENHGGDSHHGGDSREGGCRNPFEDAPDVLKAGDMENDALKEVLESMSPNDIRTFLQRLRHDFKRMVFDVDAMIAADGLFGDNGEINPAFAAVEFKFLEHYMEIQDDFHELPAIEEVLNRDQHFLGDCIMNAASTNWMAMSHDVNYFVNEILDAGLKCLRTAGNKYIEHLDHSTLSDDDLHDPVTMKGTIQTMKEITDELRHLVNFAMEVYRGVEAVMNNEKPLSDVTKFVQCTLKDLAGMSDAICVRPEPTSAAPPNPARRELSRMLSKLLQKLH